jgi:hypothetical protein
VSKELQNDGAGEDCARNNDLNVSNLENSPSSIPDYVQPQTETVSSLSVTECSVQRENPRARVGHGDAESRGLEMLEVQISNFWILEKVLSYE